MVSQSLDVPLALYNYNIRDWSLITGRGGSTKQEGGGTSSFTPMKRGDGNSFSHAEGGHKKFRGSFYAVP